LKNEQTTSRAFQFNARTKIVDINGRMAEDFLFMQNPSYDVVVVVDDDDDDVELLEEADVRFGVVHGIPIAIVGHDGCC
jgi:hypothetical protein